MLKNDLFKTQIILWRESHTYIFKEKKISFLKFICFLPDEKMFIPSKVSKDIFAKNAKHSWII